PLPRPYAPLARGAGRGAGLPEVAMTFRAPETLVLLALVPALLALALFVARRRERATLAMGEPRLVKALVEGASPALRTTRITLFSVGVALLVFALAGPRMGSREEMVRKRGLDLVVALDFSKSMWA